MKHTKITCIQTKKPKHNNQTRSGPTAGEEAAKQVGDEKIKGKNPKGATRCLQSKHLRGETHNLYY